MRRGLFTFSIKLAILIASFARASRFFVHFFTVLARLRQAFSRPRCRRRRRC